MIFSHARPSIIQAVGGRSYTRDPSAWQSSNTTAISYQAEMEAANMNALSCLFVSLLMPTFSGIWLWWNLTTYEISTLIIWKKQSIQMTATYQRSWKLNWSKMMRRSYSFQPLKLEYGPFESHLFYNSQTDVGKAVKQAYLLGKADKTRDVAITLRADVQKAHTRTLIQSHGLHLLGT